MSEQPLARTRADLETLVRQRSDLWYGRKGPERAALPTGWPGLDAHLPDGGWPRGALIELMPRQLGLGELSLLLPALAEQTRQKQPVVLSAPPLVPCPQALSRRGVDLSRLVIVRNRAHALWATEQCLKSGVCGSVLFWQARGRTDPRALRRLRLAAENGPAPLFVWYRPGQQPPASVATLRLEIGPGPTVEILRGQRGGQTGTFSPAADNVVAWQPHRRPQGDARQA